MYQTCPKCGHGRDTDEGPSDQCPACGLIYEKYLRSRFRTEDDHTSHATQSRGKTGGDRVAALLGQLRTLALQIPTPVNPVVFYGQAGAWLIFFGWGWNFILMDYYHIQAGLRVDHVVPEIGQSFMHNINLVFHEAGHVIFTPFGRFMQVLGGSLFQILVPLIVAGAFLVKEHNPFGASIGLWWMGQSMMDVAPYINDARNGQIMLLGGTTGAESEGYHDWETLLTMLGKMEYDHALAGFVDGLGTLIMLLAMVWGGLLLRMQYRALH